MRRSTSQWCDSEGTEPILALLLPVAAERGMIDSVDGAKCTPLYVAVEKKRPIAVNLLLQKGANPWVNTHRFSCVLLEINLLLIIDGLVQYCSNSSALALELLQSCTKPSTCTFAQMHWVLLGKSLMKWTPGYTNRGEVLFFLLNLSSDLTLHKSRLNSRLKSEIILNSETAPRPRWYSYRKFAFLRLIVF